MPSTRRERAICTTSSSSARLRSGAILSSTGESPAFLRTRSRASITLASRSSSAAGLLQIAQARRVRRGDVDGEIARDRREHLDQPDVVGDAVGRILVGPDIDADDAALMRARRQPPQHRVGAVIVEAHAVDDGFVALQAKQPRPRIAALRLRRHRADLDKAETEPQQRVRHLGALVEARGHADRIGKIQAEGAHRQFRIVGARLEPAAAAAGPGSPSGAHPPDRTSAAAAAKRRRRRGSRHQLRKVVIAVRPRAQVEDGGYRAEVEFAIEVRKQLVVARGLPAQRVAERIGIDGDQEQPGLARNSAFAPSPRPAPPSKNG